MLSTADFARLTCGRFYLGGCVIDIKVTHNLSELASQVSVWQRDQIPFAMALTLTKMAKTAEREIVQAMPREFDRPNQYTLRSTFVKIAKPKDLVALVKLKDRAPSGGNAANTYLSPQVHAGEREYKRFERALYVNGLLPKGFYAVPGDAAVLDQHGNIARGQIMNIISALKAKKKKSSDETPVPKKRITSVPSGEYFFLPQARGRLLPGIYQRFTFGFGSALKPILIYIRKPLYDKRLTFYEIAANVIARDSQMEFDRALVQAIKTKR